MTYPTTTGSKHARVRDVCELLRRGPGRRKAEGPERGRRVRPRPGRGSASAQVRTGVGAVGGPCRRPGVRRPAREPVGREERKAASPRAQSRVPGALSWAREGRRAPPTRRGGVGSHGSRVLWAGPRRARSLRRCRPRVAPPLAPPPGRWRARLVPGGVRTHRGRGGGAGAGAGREGRASMSGGPRRPGRPLAVRCTGVPSARRVAAAAMAAGEGRLRLARPSAAPAPRGWGGPKGVPRGRGAGVGPRGGRGRGASAPTRARRRAVAGRPRVHHPRPGPSPRPHAARAPGPLLTVSPSLTYLGAVELTDSRTYLLTPSRTPRPPRPPYLFTLLITCPRFHSLSHLPGNFGSPTVITGRVGKVAR